MISLYQRFSLQQKLLKRAIPRMDGLFSRMTSQFRPQVFSDQPEVFSHLPQWKQLLYPVFLFPYQKHKISNTLAINLLENTRHSRTVPSYRLQHHFTRYASTKERNWSSVRWSQPMRSIMAYSLLLLDMTNFSCTPLAEHRRW